MIQQAKAGILKKAEQEAMALVSNLVREDQLARLKLLREGEEDDSWVGGAKDEGWRSER